MELTRLSFELHSSKKISWAKKARANWLYLGDKNIRFFQMHVTIRKKRYNITKIKDDYGNWITNMQSISDFFVHDFRK